MFIRSALTAALILAAAPALAGQSASPDRGPTAAALSANRNWTAPSLPQGGLQSYVLIPAPDPLGDVMNGRGPNPHAQMIAQYAVYDQVGNRAGMEILAAQLREFGTDREELLEVADHMALHVGSLPRLDPTD